MVKKFKKKKFLFIIPALLILIFIIFFFNICKINISNLLNNKYCGDGFRIELIRFVKSNKEIYSYIEGTIRYITYKTDFIIPHSKYVQLFNNNDLNSKITDKEFPYSIESIINNDNFFIGKKNFHDHYETIDWKRSHGGNHNLKFNENNFINENNIQNLKLVWSYQGIKEKDIKNLWKQNIQSNPIVINKKIISVFPDFFVRAFEAATGKLLWEIKIREEMPNRRGMLGETDNTGEYLYISFGNFMYKINAQNGNIIKNFGKNSSIKVDTLVAPSIYKNQLIIINKSNIEIFDKNTGSKLSKINYHDDKNFLNGNVWGGSAFDKDKGIIFLATGNPFPTTYGVKRKGHNNRSNSVIAIDLINQKILWSFQETSHDLWNLDIPSPPILHNIKFDKGIIESVIVPTKAGNTLILERNSGKLVYGAYYKKVPMSDIPGEKNSPQQLYIKKPERFSKIEFDYQDFNKLSKDKQNEISEKIKNSKFGWYEPPSFNKDLITFGIHGGAQWQGAALDPINQYLYIPVNNVPWRLKLNMSSIESTIPNIPKEFKAAQNFYNSKCASCHGSFRNGKFDKDLDKLINDIPSLVGIFFKDKNYNTNIFSASNIEKIHKNNLLITDQDINNLKNYFYWWDKKIYKEKKIIINGDYRTISQFLTSDDLPASNPPWGYIAKLDIVTGKILYKSPIGFIENNLIGTTIFGGIAINGGNLIFANGTEDGKAYVLKADNGEILWTFQMEAAGSAPPTIFNIDNKQYVSFLATGGGYYSYKKKGSTLYTFSIN
jgi:quinoprotein glucose dehydrogenase